MTVTESFIQRFQGMLVRHLLCLLPLALCLLLTACLIGTGADLAAFYKAYRMEHLRLTGFAKLLTNWGNPLLYLVYATLLGYGIWKKDVSTILFVLCYIVFQLFFAFLIVHILKISLGIPRPYVTDTTPMPFSLNPRYHSFPSGHNAEIVGACVPLASRYRRWGITLLASLLICLVGYSRIYLGVHHLRDVIVGMILGSLAAVGTWYFSQHPRLQALLGDLTMPKRAEHKRLNTNI